MVQTIYDPPTIGPFASEEIALPRDTRQQMIITAVSVLREHGADGLTVDEVLLRSGAPKGSVYYHFPGGRTELIGEAITFAGDSMGKLIERASQDGPGAVLDAFIGVWRDILVSSDYAAGCPVLAVALSRNDGSDLVDQARTIFDGWTALLAHAFVVAGATEDTADRLAGVAIAAIEGAVALCRIRRSVEPLEDTAQQIRILANCHRFVQDSFAAAR